jgi:hypothetical protein
MPTWPSNVKPLLVSELSRALDSPRLVGIHCWAHWSQHDHEFARWLAVIATRYAGLIDLYAMDSENAANVDQIASWGIMNLPAFVVFRGEGWLDTLWMGGEAAEFQQRVERCLVKLTTY